jgi:hypothetical protein
MSNEMLRGCHGFDGFRGGGYGLVAGQTVLIWKSIPMVILGYSPKFDSTNSAHRYD